MSDAIPSTLGQFVNGMRGLWSAPLADEARWQRAGELLAVLLRNETLAHDAATWPSNEESGGRYSNFLFYEDAALGFVVNGLVKSAGSATPVHDHGDSWTIYGVLTGRERILHYALGGADAGPLTVVAACDAGRGFVDVVPPGRIHAEIAGPERTVAIIVRSRKVGGFLQNMYDPATGAIARRPGPLQRPFRLTGSAAGPDPE